MPEDSSNSNRLDEIEASSEIVEANGDYSEVKDMPDEDHHSKMQLESPASPDGLNTMITGSPLKIIPSSSTHDSVGVTTDEAVSEDEDEDEVDEDILYLRLIALRSIDAGETQEETMEREMQQLLEEADEAAQQSAQGK